MSISRRAFLQGAAAVSAGVLVGDAMHVAAFAGGSDTLRVGLIGSGGRGVGAAINCVSAAPGVRIVAIGDLFADRVEQAVRRLRDFANRDAANAAKIDLPPERCFSGWDNYQKVIDCGLDLVLLTAPPGFRPPHYEAAIKAGKHVFMEKPVAVDPAGVRRIIAASEEATRKGLGVVAGTQRRHQGNYVQTLKRIHDGALGELIGGQCYWNQGGLGVRRRTPQMCDMHWQVRNWYYFTWLSGDHIVEQHVHNIDVINWAFATLPVKALGMGGREVRTGPEYGNIYDHFAVEFEYPNGARVMSMCRQIPGTSNRVGERVVGTRGASNCAGDIRAHDGEPIWRYSGQHANPFVQEHTNLIESIRAGRPLNEGIQIAHSSGCAILGRMSAYTGRECSWDWLINASQLDLTPSQYAFGPNPVDGVAEPGRRPLI